MVGLLSAALAALRYLPVIGSTIGRLLDAREQTKQAQAEADGRIGAGLARTIEAEAAGRAQVQVAHASAGWWWMTIPFLMIAGSSAVYYVLIIADTLAGWSWNVEKLPPPFDATVNQIILVTGGVSGAAGLLGLLLRGR